MPYTPILGNTPLATEKELIEWYNDLREYFVDLYSRLEQLEERSGTSEDTADKLGRERKSDRTEIGKLAKKVETLTGLLDQFGQRLDRIEKQIASPAFEKEIESMFQRQFERFEQSFQTRASGPSPEKPSRQDR